MRIIVFLSKINFLPCKKSFFSLKNKYLDFNLFDTNEIYLIKFSPIKIALEKFENCSF